MTTTTGNPSTAQAQTAAFSRVDRVAAAHSLRILLVVTIVPATFTLAGVHGTDIFQPARAAFDAPGFALLMAATFVGAVVARRFDLPNAFILGSLAVAIPLTAAGLPLSAVPAPMLNAGQLLLGCALGARFEPDFLRGAPRFIGAVAATVLLLIVTSTALGFVLAKLSGESVASVVLGMAPGGIAEMTVTVEIALEDAEALKADVTYVLTLQRELRGLPYFIFRLRRPGDERKETKNPHLIMSSIRDGEGKSSRGSGRVPIPDSSSTRSPCRPARS